MHVSVCMHQVCVCLQDSAGQLVAVLITFSVKNASVQLIAEKRVKSVEFRHLL